MIIIVAPYSPVSMSNSPHLGAARKIEMVVEALFELDKNVILVNSAHNNLSSSEKIDEIIIGNANVKHISLPCYSSQKIGKMLNLKDVNLAVNKCLMLGSPKLLWIYNSYAFENLFSIVLKKRVNLPVILEFEDWHYSRSRGANPKPYIDNLLWKLNIKNINFSFGVNDNLVSKMKCFGVKSQLLPGIVPETLMELCDRKTPFEIDNEDIRIGYFGGLSEEKGVDRIIDVTSQLPVGFKLVVSGAGPLESTLNILMEKFPEKIEFHGRVSENRLYDLIASTDVVLNPHSPISDMSGGVFPFKVIEAIASGRLLISTELPAANVNNLLDGVLFYDGTSEELLARILMSKNYYDEFRLDALNSMNIAREAFAKKSILKPISNILKEFKGI